MTRVMGFLQWRSCGPTRGSQEERRGQKSGCDGGGWEETVKTKEVKKKNTVEVVQRRGVGYQTAARFPDEIDVE